MADQKSVDDVEKFWSASAATFDESADHGLTDPGVRAAWQRRLASWMPPGVASVADLGCGTGSLSLLAAEFGCEVFGIDVSPAMIEIATAKAATAQTNDVHFEVGDACDPAIDHGSVDVVMARHLLWTLPSPAEVLTRWSALLKPSGRAILIEGVWGPVVAEDDPRRETFPWWGGVPAATLVDELSSRFETVTLFPLSDETALWGHRVSDERYAVVAETPKA